MQQQTQQVLALEVAVLWVCLAFVLPGGDDLYRYYQPFQKGCVSCGFVPPYARWFLWLLTVLPTYPLTWPLWTLMSVSIWLILTCWTRVNPLLLMLSFPLWGQLWLGQIDWLVACGLVLFLAAKRPDLRGLGILLALIKPQLSALAILYILLQEKPRSIIRISLLPLAGFVLSLWVYGWRWPLEWLTISAAAVPVHHWRLAGLDTWRVGIFFIWLPLLFKDPRQRLVASLLISAVATPFFGVYSYVIFLIFVLPWWAVPLSYTWILASPWLSSDAMRFAWVLPLALLIWMLRESRRHAPTPDLCLNNQTPT
ncbi:MAG: hypothetical protein WCK35_06250 [Chloroflexota bacterium]